MENKNFDTVNTNNNQFKSFIETSIQKQIDDILSQEFAPNSMLLPTEAYRKKLENEIRESLDYSEFSKHISISLKILEKEGKNYINESEYITLIKDLYKLKNNINSVDLTVQDLKFQETFTLPPSSLALILQIGLAKFNEGKFNESLSIFAFLSSLDSNNSDYIYRLGCNAMICEQYELALRAFKAAKILAPEFIGIKIFAAECYFFCNLRDEAETELSEAKELIKTIPNKNNWEACINDLEYLFHTK